MFHISSVVTVIEQVAALFVNGEPAHDTNIAAGPSSTNGHGGSYHPRCSLFALGHNNRQAVSVMAYTFRFIAATRAAMGLSFLAGNCLE